MAVDFVGREIHIGDKVVYCRNVKHNRQTTMSKHVVMGFSKRDKVVYLEPKVVGTYGDENGYSHAKSHNCVVYEGVEDGSSTT